MKKVLICGATGFIGKNITLGLSKNKNYEIIAVRFKRPAYKTPKNVKRALIAPRFLTPYISAHKELDIFSVKPFDNPRPAM